jgi:hypothetical protein
MKGRTAQENTMSMQSEGKDAEGRNYDQVTRDGSSSAGSVGTGGTGDIATPGNVQSATRTDDWLTSDTEQERQQGFRPSEPGAVRTGMEGIGKAGNRQSSD